MKLKDLIPKLQALNPEADVWVYSGGWESEPGELAAVWAAQKTGPWGEADTFHPKREPTATDTCIMLDIA